MLGSTEEAQLYCPPSVYGTGWRGPTREAHKSQQTVLHVQSLFPAWTKQWGCASETVAGCLLCDSGGHLLDLTAAPNGKSKKQPQECWTAVPQVAMGKAGCRAWLSLSQLSQRTCLSTGLASKHQDFTWVVKAALSSLCFLETTFIHWHK